MTAPRKSADADWAALLRHGIHLLPLVPGRKTPIRIWKEFRQRLPTEDELAHWRKCKFNVGIVTGLQSGVIALDLDSEAALAKATGLGLPKTVSVRTPRGRHYYFKHPGRAISNKVALFEGADLRGDGGYVVGPGSSYVPTAKELADGKIAGRYEFIVGPDEVDLAPPPPWLLELLHREPDPHLTRSASDGGDPCSDSAQLALSLLKNAREGERNDRLNSAAFKLAMEFAAGRVGEDMAKDSLRSAATTVGLERIEVERTLASGWAAGLRQAPVEPTEDGIARAFTLRHGSDFEFDPRTGTWFAWSDGRWKSSSSHLVLDLLRRIAREAGKPAMRCSRVVKGAETLLRADPAHRSDQDWDDQPWLLGVETGVVDVRTGELRLARREDRVTKSTKLVPREGPPRRWIRFLEEATNGDLELIAFLQRVCGYALTGLTTEQVFFFIYGSGGNGKSVFLETLNHCLGDYFITSNMDAFTVTEGGRHPTELARLKGYRLAAASETRAGSRWDEAKLKQLTGGDPITARFMCQDHFTYSPQFKLLFAGNHRPQLSSIDEAIKRRLLLVPFIVRPSKPDKALTSKLRQEADAILAWMIQGCLDWQASGLAPPPSVRNETNAYFEAEDHIGRWIDECCREGASEKSTPTELYESWCEFADGQTIPFLGAGAFGNLLEARGYRRYKSNGVRYHAGLLPLGQGRGGTAL